MSINDSIGLSMRDLVNARHQFGRQLHGHLWKAHIGWHIFQEAHVDYIKFLCSVPGVDWHEVRNITGVPCMSTYMHPAELNIPSVAVSHLKGTRIIKRTVTNVGPETETYTITSHMSPEVALEVGPPAFTILPGQSRDVTITLTARSVTGTYSFGEVLMKGDKGHKVRIPVVAMGFGS